VEATVFSDFELMKDEIENITLNIGTLTLSDYIKKYRVLL
jgi:hypothetical protein